jgi:MFS family permease
MDANEAPMPVDAASEEIVETDIPARLDRLPWGRFHTMVVIGLGVTWMLDGLEVTLVGAIGGALKQDKMLALTDTQVGLGGSAYLVGAVLGALLFGYLTDLYGRQKLFFVTLGVYLAATALTSLSWSFWSFAFFRFFVGAGIGGEYAAVNSAIQELIPARVRGHTDLVINGSFWIGAALGALGSLVLLDAALAPPAYGWRSAFLIGAILGLPVFFLRFFIPESPRWLAMHGREGEAEKVMEDIERHFPEGREDRHRLKKMRMRRRSHTPQSEIFATLFKTYPLRAFVGLSLVTAQAFLYNAVFFTYALTLDDFYRVAPRDASWHLLALAISNFLGPLALGKLFDTLGRKVMIGSTYAISGLLMLVVGLLFALNMLTAAQQTAGWMLTFFFASAAAGSAYLTVSEIFPFEIRAMAIALFYAFGTAIGGVSGPVLFGALIGSGQRWDIFYGYALGAILMIGAGVIEWFFGISAEGKPLESVAPPLSLAKES